MLRNTIWLTLLTVLSLACASSDPAPIAGGGDVREPSATSSPVIDVPTTARPSGAADGDAAFTGTLAGSAELEGGCMWLEDGDETYQLAPAAGADFTLDTRSIRILGADGSVVAEAGDQIRVDGAVDHDLLSFCQVGPILQATQITTG